MSRVQLNNLQADSPWSPLTAAADAASGCGWRYPGLGLGALLLLLWLGLSFAGLKWHLGLVDREWREQLLQQAIFLAKSLDPELIHKLTFTAADGPRPEFQRLNRYFKDYLPLIGCRGIYTLAARDGQLRFGPESYDPDDPQASPPGTVYQQPSPELLDFFHQPRPFTKGPWTDEYGTFFSAIAPVYDPYTGKLLMAVGLDVESADWQAALRWVWLWGGALSAGWGLLLVWGFWLWCRRDRWPRAPVILTTALGLTLTATTTLLFFDWQNHAQRAALRREAAVQAEQVIKNYRDFQDRLLLALGRFFESSEEVTREEFHHYTAPLLAKPLPAALFWLPVVEDAHRKKWELQVQASGRPDFRIRELAPDGQLRPAATRSDYFPIMYYAPESEGYTVLGYDLGAEPHLRTLLTQTGAVGFSGLSLCPKPLALDQGDLLAWQPVFKSQAEGNRLLGWVAARIGMAAFLSPAGSSYDLEPRLAAAIFQVKSGLAPVLLGQQGSPEENPPALTYPKTGRWSPKLETVQIFPLFMGGQTLAVLLTPRSAFWGAFSSSAIWLIAVSGLLLTLMGALLAWVITSRRLELEGLVSSRTTALRDRETYLATLLDVLGDGVFITTFPERRITYVNRAGGTIFGCQPEDLIGRNTQVLYYTPQEYERYGQIVGTALARGEKRAQGEIQFRCQDGSLIWGEVHTVFLKQEGQIKFLVSVVRDITARKKLESDREQLQLQLFQAQKMEAVGRLAGGIAHDFNNLLSLILGQMELVLLDLPDNSPWRQPCEVILEAGQRAADLTRQLLIFTRQQPAAPQVLDLNAAISSQLKLLSRLLSEEISLSWIPAPELWPVRLDPQQLQQVLSNLLINARDAIQGPGKITLETAQVELDADYCRTHYGVSPGAYVLLTVSDTGCGMDRETMSRIFEPFLPPNRQAKELAWDWPRFMALSGSMGASSRFIANWGRDRPLRSICLVIWKPYRPPLRPNQRCCPGRRPFWWWKMTPLYSRSPASFWNTWVIRC